MPAKASIWLVIGFVCVALGVQAQPWNNLRQRKVAVQMPLQVLDSLPVVPGTFLLTGAPPEYYRLDDMTATLHWHHRPAADSVWVSYRVFGTRLQGSVQRYRYDSIADFFRAAPPVVSARQQQQPNARPGILDLGNLQYTGSFGRSLSFGNAQDAVVNSLFNLQISGMLGDSIEVAAAITDNNIPILPDGTTQQLNEFDRIWLQFKKRPWELNLGDIDIRENPSYFLSYFKRQQGIAFRTDWNTGRQTRHSTLASSAIAKGKFTRNIFMGLEGNQGPYRLRGANNELFFIILPGTERVFIDGEMMQRGEDLDYVINYHTAEIRFTPRQLINKDKRIQVEFEYADRNYLNSLLYLGHDLQHGDKLKIRLGWYANTDARNAPINQTLDAQQRQFLSEIGDSIHRALYPVAIPDTFSTSKILYRKVDTVFNGGTYSIYRYQPFPDTGLYQLSFTELGPNRGNYLPLFNAANGKVFEWVAPVNGQPQGTHEPVALLVTPKSQQMATMAMEYALSDRTKVLADVGVSRYDLNRLSSRDKGDDAGLGWKLQLEDLRPVKLKGKSHTLNLGAGYEYVGERFRPLERLRAVEFLRDWGLPFETGAATERLPSVSVGLSNAAGQQVSYRYQGYQRSDGYKGHRHELQHEARWKDWQLSDHFRITTMDAGGFRGHFLRPSVQLAKSHSRWKGLETGIRYALEHNELRHPGSDSLLPVSFSFRDWNAWVRAPGANGNRWSLGWFSRANQQVGSDRFLPLDNQNTLSAQWERLSNPKHQWRLNASYRDLRVRSDRPTTLQPERSLVGRGEYQMTEWKGALTGQLLYEVGAGQEQRRDVSYVEVPAGRGEYTWIDYNGDGVPQLNEFEIALFPDQARYIRIFTPTNDFVKAAYNTLNYSVNFTPRLLWRNSKISWQKFLSRFAAQSAMQVTRKQISDGRLLTHPFGGSDADTNLISLVSNLANTLSYNRTSTVWGADFTQVRNTVKAILTYGFETRSTTDYTLRLRRNFGKQFTTELAGRTGTNRLATPNPKFDNRNYDIRHHGIEPRVTYTRGTVFRTMLGYRFDDKQGESEQGPQRSKVHSVNLESKYNVVQHSVLTGRLTYTQIDFNGPANTTIGYIMLEALQPGRNLLWNLEFTRRLATSLELSLNYEGRKAGETRTVHIGRAALRAVL